MQMSQEPVGDAIERVLNVLLMARDAPSMDGPVAKAATVRC